MAVVDVPVAPPDAGDLHRLIRRTRFLLRATRLATGLALTAGLFLGALAVALAADLLLPLLQLPYSLMHGWDVDLRISALCLVVLPAAAAFLLGVLFPLLRRLTANQVARRIEALLPGIHNRLVSCIDLEKTGRAASSPVFYRRLVAESLAPHPRLPAGPRPGLRRPPPGRPGCGGRRGRVHSGLLSVLGAAADGADPRVPPLRRRPALRRRGLHRPAPGRRLPPPGQNRLLRPGHARPGRDADAGNAGRRRDDPYAGLRRGARRRVLVRPAARHGQPRRRVPGRLRLPRLRRRDLERPLPHPPAAAALHQGQRDVRRVLPRLHGPAGAARAAAAARCQRAGGRRNRVGGPRRGPGEGGRDRAGPPRAAAARHIGANGAGMVQE